MTFSTSVRPVAIAAFAATVVLGACATAGVAPVAELVTARTSITQAESAGALQWAPVELLAAREKLGNAEVATRDEHYALARRFAEQAAADAELAERKARAANSIRAVEELQRANAVLEEEIARKPRP